VRISCEFIARSVPFSGGTKEKPLCLQGATAVKSGFKWWWGGYRVKSLVVQEVRAVDNACGMMGIRAKKQAVFVFFA
jgi:hypothetical protein